MRSAGTTTTISCNLGLAFHGLVLLHSERASIALHQGGMYCVSDGNDLALGGVQVG